MKCFMNKNQKNVLCIAFHTILLYLTIAYSQHIPTKKTRNGSKKEVIYHCIYLQSDHFQEEARLWHHHAMGTCLHIGQY